MYLASQLDQTAKLAKNLKVMMKNVEAAYWVIPIATFDVYRMSRLPAAAYDQIQR